jgi:hypothetical protein
MVDDRTTSRTLSPERTCLQDGTDEQSHLQKVQRRKLNEPHTSLCDCEAIAYFSFRHLGHYFMQKGDYQDAPVSKILHLIRNVGLLRG